MQRPPPEPRPRTVVWRYSEIFRQFVWDNTCPFCRQVSRVGDWLAYQDEVEAFVDLRLKRRRRLQPR